MEESYFAQLKQEFAHELRQRHDHFDEFDLRRALQGHDNNIEHIRKFFRSHLRFMSSVDWSRFERHPVLKEYCPFGYLGETGKNDDTFLYVETMGRADAPGLLNTTSMTTLILDRLYVKETMTRELRRYEIEHGRRAKIIFICDLEEFSFDSSMISVVTSRQFKVVSKFFSDRYSEFLKKILVVNCPSYIYYAWRMTQPMLPEKMRQKVEILHGDDWREKLLTYVAPERLPAHWGGTMTDPNGDPMCRSRVVVPPGKIPRELQWHLSADDPTTADQFRTISIAAGHFEYVDTKITDAELAEKKPRKLKWFFTTSGDFSFGVFFRSAESKKETADDHLHMEMVYPFFEHLPGPTRVPEKASIMCEKSGVYRMRFGNEMGSRWSKLKISLYSKCE